MYKCITLNQEQKDFMKEKFLYGSGLLENVVSWEETEDEIRIDLVPTRGVGISVWSRYRSQIIWFNIFSNIMFIVFKKDNSLKALLKKNLSVLGRYAMECRGKI